MLIVLLVTLSLLLGLPLDVWGGAWGQPLLGIWNLGLLGWWMWRRPEERGALLTCLLLAWVGEILLGEVWDLYDYRLGNLPLYIPAGHALVFAAATRLARVAPTWLPRATLLATAAYAALAIPSGFDTAALLWAPPLLAFLAWGRNRQLYATMALGALAIEVWGTALGAWAYHPEVPWLGLSSPNPPVLAGVFYCFLDVLVLGRERLPGVWRSTPGSAAG